MLTKHGLTGPESPRSSRWSRSTSSRRSRFRCRSLTSVASGAPYGHLYFLFALLGCYLVIPILDRLSSPELGVAAACALGWAVAQRALQLVMPHSAANALELWLYFVGFFVAGGWLARRPLGVAARWLVVGGAAVAVTAVGTPARIARSHPCIDADPIHPRDRRRLTARTGHRSARWNAGWVLDPGMYGYRISAQATGSAPRSTGYRSRTT